MTADAPVAPPTPEAVASNLAAASPLSILVIAAIFVWPIGLAALVRGLRWPQFVRPLALTLVAFALRPVYLLIGLVAAALLSGGWAGLAYHALWHLDPSNLLILGCSACSSRGPPGGRTGSSASWCPTPGGRPPSGGPWEATWPWPPRSRTRRSWPASIVWAGYVNAVQFRLPTAVNRKAAAAMAQFEAGTALISPILRRPRATSAGRYRSGRSWSGRSRPNSTTRSIWRQPAPTSRWVRGRRAASPKRGSNSPGPPHNGKPSRPVRSPRRRGRSSTGTAT